MNNEIFLFDRPVLAYIIQHTLHTSFRYFTMMDQGYLYKLIMIVYIR